MDEVRQAMKTTLEIRDSTFRRAKLAAAEQGVTLKELINAALEEKLQHGANGGEKAHAWLKLAGMFGKTASEGAETRRIQEVIDAEFEVVDPERL
jgi:hypothetical protein